MSKSSHFQRLPVEVEPFKLVEQHRVLDGRIPLRDFSRLDQQLLSHDKSSDDESIVFVHLEFIKTNTGLASIKGNIQADLDMNCQRCLQVKTESFETDFEVVLVTTDEQAERLQEGFDTWFVEDKKILLTDFIEDEILLALPLAVTHDDCKPSRELIEATPDDIKEAENSDSSEKENPFAVLKDLKLK